MKFGDWQRGGRNFEGDGDDMEYYEDTHNERGEYVGKGEMPQYSTTQSMNAQAMRMPKASDYISPRNYQNVVVYEPRTPEDVQTLIDYLKRREPAIINLDKTPPETAQRILDFASGAIYALNGSVHRISGNIFLLSPEGVEITVPYEL